MSSKSVRRRRARTKRQADRKESEAVLAALARPPARPRPARGWEDTLIAELRAQDARLGR